MTGLFEYPAKARLGRVVPKAKIYDHAGASAHLKNRFVEEVAEIRWAYKLAPSTINLDASPAVPEIEIFEVALRTQKPSEELFRAMDEAIPFPLIFELVYEGRRKAMAANKQPSPARPGNWTLSSYFSGPWVEEPAARAPLPVALSLQALYEAIIGSILGASHAGQASGELGGFGEAPQQPLVMDVPVAMPGSIAERIAREEAIALHKRRIAKLEGQMAREKQYNKRVAINAELRKANQELAELKSTDAVWAKALSAATNK